MVRFRGLRPRRLTLFLAIATGAILTGFLVSPGTAGRPPSAVVSLAGSAIEATVTEEFKGCGGHFFNQSNSPMFRWAVRFCPYDDRGPLAPQEVLDAYVWGRFCDGATPIVDTQHLACRSDIAEEAVYDRANQAVGSKRYLVLLFKTVPVPWLKQQTLPLVVTMTPQVPRQALLPPELATAVAMEKCRSVHVTLNTPTLLGSFDATACSTDDGGGQCVTLHEVWGTEGKAGVRGNDSAILSATVASVPMMKAAAAPFVWGARREACLTPHGRMIRAIARSMAAQLDQARKDSVSSLSAAAFVRRIGSR